MGVTKLLLLFRYEKAGPVSVTRTSNIVLSYIWEITILHEQPEWTSLLGAGMVSSCVVLLAVNKWRKENPRLFDSCFPFNLLAKKKDGSTATESTSVATSNEDSMSTLSKNCAIVQVAPLAFDNPKQDSQFVYKL